MSPAADLPGPTHVYAGERAELLHFVPDGVRSILDVGCASGGFGSLLRARFGPDLHLEGIEPVEAARHHAEQAGFDRVRPGFFPDAVGPDERFDCIVFNDVLEHMLDPWAAVRAARQHLTPDGVVVACLPNILYLPVIARVIYRRRWDYTDEGTLDRTHVRFFTKATMVEMFEDNGYVVDVVEGVNNYWVHGRWRHLQRFARFAGEYQYLQFGIVARPRA